MNTIEIIGISIGIVATVLSGVWFIVQRAFDSGIDKKRLESIENRTCNANCNTHTQEITESKSERKELNSTLSSLTGKVNQIDKTLNNTAAIVENISNWIMKKDNKMIGNLSVKKSPRKLNDLGTKILNDINGTEFLSIHKDTLFEWMGKYNLQTSLDVENASNAALFYNSSDPIFNDIKNYIYNAPSQTAIGDDGIEKTYDVSLEDVCFVISLPLRDMYLEEHPEKPVDPKESKENKV